MDKADLDQFIGTSQYYKNFTGLLYTDGVQYLAENAKGYWLIDAIGSYQRKLLKTPELRDFQVWNLKVSNNSAILTCKADSNCKPVVTQHIEFTDFPFDIELWVENGVLILPSEH